MMKKVIRLTAPRFCLNLGKKYTEPLGLSLGDQVQVVGKKDRLVVYPLHTELCSTCLEPKGECTCVAK